jgi:hypothetical protein
MRENIAEAIENAAINGGHVTPTYLQNLITQVTNKIDGLDRRFCHFEGLIKGGVPLLQQPQATSATVFDSSSTPDQWRYCYGGRFYSVPQGFELPTKLKLRAAFGLWINGDPSLKSYQKPPGRSEEKVLTATPIKAYRLIQSKMLPKDIARKFKVSWMPILKLMTSVCNNLPASATGEALDALYKQGLEQVRNNAAYIFAEGRYEYTNWALSTWSRMIIPSALSKNGTEADKARLVGRQSKTSRQNPRTSSTQEKAQSEYREQLDRETDTTATSNSCSSSATINSCSSSSCSSSATINSCSSSSASDFCRIWILCNSRMWSCCWR